MEIGQLTELLNRHVDRLQAGEDLTEQLRAELAAGPATLGLSASAVDELLRLAQRLHAALVPVEPRPAFLAGLRAQLLAGPAPERQARVARARRPGPWVWWAAGVGGVLSLVGLGILGYRVFAVHRSSESGIMAQRVAQTVLPDIQPAP